MSHTTEEFEPGDRVIYHPTPKTSEVGTVTSVTSAWVFVRYDGTETSKATSPSALTWLVNQ